MHLPYVGEGVAGEHQDHNLLETRKRDLFHRLDPRLGQVPEEEPALDVVVKHGDDPGPPAEVGRR